MFLDLYKLYKKNGYSERSPLEDFNTEVFAGILKLKPDLLEDFIELIDLPKDDYKVKTQIRYSLLDRPDCIIDLVLIGDDNICFIENKVNSGEGWEQLDRYCEALTSHFSQIKKHLVYCTKFTDHKNIAEHNFKQIRWYQVAAILDKYLHEDSYLHNYYKFLNHHNMTQKNSFSPEMVISMQNMRDTVETMNLHVENARPYFNSIFKIHKSKAQEASTSDKDRVAGYIDNILPEHKACSEILYCIKVSLVKLQTHVFIDKSHPKMEEVKKRINQYISDNETCKLNFRPHPVGFVIVMERKIYDLINDPEADDKIKNWFIDSFYEFSSFFKATPELGWISPFLNRDIFWEYERFLRSVNNKPLTVNFYTVMAKQFVKAGWKEEEWGEMDLCNNNSENIERMRSLTLGDHEQQFEGKNNFLKFLDQKMEQQQSSLISD